MRSSLGYLTVAVGTVPGLTTVLGLSTVKER